MLCANGRAKRRVSWWCSDRVMSHRPDGVGGEAATPELLAEPIPHLRGHPFDIRLQHEADTADRLVVHGDGEECFGGHLLHVAKVGVRVGNGVRIRKAIAEVQPDLAVVRVPDDGGRVTRPPGSDRAVREGNVHDAGRAAQRCRARSSAR